MAAATKKRPGRPPKDLKNTEHILISARLKEGLEVLRIVNNKESYGEVVFELYHRHIFNLSCMKFLQQLAILNKKDNETEADSFSRMIIRKPIKIEMSTTPLWSDGQDIKTT